jgi:mRNA interferase MazF
VVKRYIPQRGDIIKLDFDPQQRREQAGYRPAFVVSSLPFNQTTGLAMVCPITSRRKGLMLEVKLAENMETEGVILIFQLKTIDWKARAVKFIESSPEDIIQEVITKLETILL